MLLSAHMNYMRVLVIITEIITTFVISSHIGFKMSFGGTCTLLHHYSRQTALCLGNIPCTQQLILDIFNTVF